MTKLRKQRRRKKYNVNLNRKKLNRQRKFGGKIKCKPVARAWDDKKTVKTNLKQMGLVYDPNELLKKSSVRNKVKKQIKGSLKGESWTEEFLESPVILYPNKQTKIAKTPSKVHVAQELEKEAKAPREKRFALPKSQVEFLTYLLDKYGHDYKAMARDSRNYYQETWKQLRAKIKQFMKVPEQYGEYLKSRCLLDKVEDDEKIAEVLIDDDSD